MLTEPTLIAKGMTLQAKPLGEKLQFSIAFVSWSKYRAESPTPTIFVAEGQWATVEDFLFVDLEREAPITFKTGMEP